MEVNKKILKYGITLLIIVTFICCAIRWHLRLREPIFLKSYAQYIIDTENDSVEFPLQYITNRDKTIFMWKISFANQPDLNVSYNTDPVMISAFVNKWDNADIAEIYSKQTVYVTIENISNYDLETLDLSKAVAYFSDSSIVEVELGQIELIENDYKEGGLSTLSSSSSNQGDSRVSYEAKHKIYLSSIVNPYAERFGDSLTLELIGNQWTYQLPQTNEVDLKDYVLKPEETLTVSSFLNVSDHNELKYAIIDIKPLFIYQDEQGNTFEERIYDINYSPYFNHWWEIFQYMNGGR